MWCKHCRQDVPGIVVAQGAKGATSASGGDGFLMHPPAYFEAAATDAPSGAASTNFVCARCGQPIGSNPDADVNKSKTCDESNDPISKFETWQWELDQELHDVRRLLESQMKTGQGPSADSQQVAGDVLSNALPPESPSDSRLPNTTFRIHSAHQQRSQPESSSGGTGLSWLTLALGLMVLACGGVLLGWSLFTGRAELWNLGLPIAIGGQALMLVGFLFVMERIWRDQRSATNKLDVVDDKLANLRQTTALLGTSSKSGPQSFYTHIAEGAHPSLLLADLKSQLDMLAVKIAERD